MSKASLSLSYFQTCMEKVLESPAEDVVGPLAGGRDKPLTFKSFHLPPFPRKGSTEARVDTSDDKTKEESEEDCVGKSKAVHTAQFYKWVRPKYFVIDDELFRCGKRVLCTVELHKWVKKELRNPPKRSISAIQGVLEQVRRVFDYLSHWESPKRLDGPENLQKLGKLRDEWIATFFYKPLVQNIGGPPSDAIDQWKSCRLCTPAAEAEEDKLLEKVLKQMCPRVARKQKHAEADPTTSADPDISHTPSGDLQSAAEQDTTTPTEENTNTASLVRLPQPRDQNTGPAEVPGSTTNEPDIQPTPSGPAWADYEDEYLIDDFASTLGSL
eukprot:TRINITY_DN59_c0_g2_i1.p1 TRINITY_DN59_c0_g2~~TRINITY_DN59_c0_g2_i1.p1  ORF type:complete len:339 (-),score=57.32 TRINITY_DN59_c0_g2_i1:302-1282(-)